jgi:hypothetical protein
MLASAYVSIRQHTYAEGLFVVEGLFVAIYKDFFFLTKSAATGIDVSGIKGGGAPGASAGSTMCIDTYRQTDRHTDMQT